VDAISLTSCAKVNFGLRVVRRRPDGFHDIQTILQTIDLGDKLDISLVSGGRIQVRCDHPEVPSGPENLAHRAAEMLQREFQVEHGCRIQIAKKIPPAAGLGGGSSNAAAALTGLNRLWGLNLSQEVLLDLAARLGSDVPFFLEGGTALAEGRGERLRPIPLLAEFWLVVIKPDFSIATKWVYQQIKIPLTSNLLDVKLKSLKEISNLDQLLGFLQNDLERAVQKAYPSIGDIKTELLSKGAMGAAMSGSGSSVFGLVRTREDAEKLAERVSCAKWQIFVVRPVRRCEGPGQLDH